MGDLGCLTESQNLDTFISAVQTPYMRRITNKRYEYKRYNNHQRKIKIRFDENIKHDDNFYKTNPKLYYPWALSLLGLHLYPSFKLQSFGSFEQSGQDTKQS